MTTLPLIQDCVLIAVGTIGFDITGEVVLAGNLTDAATAINVNADSIAYVLSDEGVTYSGTGTVEPLASDRAAWDTSSYFDRHASDISDATFTYHNDPADPALSRTLTDGHIFVGDADNLAADVAMSGDATIINTGAVTIGAKKVDASKIALTDDKLLIGGADGAAHEQSMSSDATLANTGALTLATVNANVGTFGSATQVSRVTVNAKGLVTAASNVTITAGHVIQDEGAALPTEPNLNFAGSGVIASDDAGNTATLVTIEATFSVYNEIQIGTGGATYYLANEAEPDTVRAYVNGIRQPAENGTTASDVVTFSVAPAAGDTLIFDYELAVA